MKRTTFPLVADDELVVGKNPHMSLYDETDLISNIKGPYQEKDYGRKEESRLSSEQPREAVRDIPEDLFPPLYHAEPSPYSRRERLTKPLAPSAVGQARISDSKTQGQLAREQAREDLKKKRSAAYLKDDKPAPARVERREVTAPLVKERNPQLVTLADRLRQTSYILADMPAVYSLEKEDRAQQSTTRKNSYDFLKKSQVYNYPERKLHQEHQMAQELNLTHMEEEAE